MSYKYHPYTDTFEHIDDEQSTIATININNSLPYQIVRQVELTDECIQKIVDRVVKALKEVEE